MKRHIHSRSNAAEELDRQHQGAVGGQFLTRAGRNEKTGQGTISSRFESLDFTPGRDPAEGADIPLTSPLHERWAQGTPQRDPTEGPVIPTDSPRRSAK
ncbi:hypothetical protein [Geomonas edaphica]|uniref:hypothetical protein n=1 Tax=Geomonas edaphica TaxID=2570226 RepID=UPI0010A868F5|nr:hypothetical protein [Geomonas edaphica]